MATSPHLSCTVVLSDHLASRHATVLPVNTPLAELVDIHTYEHTFPGSVCDHPFTDLSSDPVQAGVARAGSVGEPANVDAVMVVCDMCFPGDVVVLGNITASLALVRINGVYQLMCEPAHSGDTLVTFEERPRPDPLGGDVLDEIDCSGDENDPRLGEDPTWPSDALDAMLPMRQLSLLGAADLVNEMVLCGFDPDRDGFAEMWLYHRAGELAAAHG